MISYTTTIDSPHDPDTTFAYLADLTHFEDWDPGTKSSTQVEGDGPGFGAAYQLKVGLISMRYEVTEFDAPKKVSAHGTHALVQSTDTMTVEPHGTGSRVVYRAELVPSGPLKVLDPLFDRMFHRMGDDAAEGLERALHGRRSDIHL